MGELLSSLDVVNKNFNRQMMGYNSTEVDEFLDVIAESIQAYVQRIKELERSLDDTTERLTKYDSIKDNLQDALLTAQQTAREKLDNASREAEGIIHDANVRAEDIAAESRLRADRMVHEAEDEAAAIAVKISTLRELEDRCISHIRSLITDVERVIVNAQSGDSIELPDFAHDFIRRADDRRAETHHAETHRVETPHSAHEHVETEPESEQAATTETKMEEISQTLNALGIDPSLIDPTV